MVVVSAPVGGFANHTTWLLWIHPEFESYIQKKPFSQEAFNFMCGEDWPDIKNLDSVTDPVARKELEYLRYIDIHPSDPVKYLLDNVYTEDRTWHNWLLREYDYRDYLYNFEITHTAQMEYTVLCTIDPEVAYTNYLKINSSLNNAGLDVFKKEIQEFNNRATSSENLVVDNTLLFKPELDLNYYKKLTDYFSLENRYNQAQVVHDAWYRAQIRSATDFTKEVLRIYG